MTVFLYYLTPLERKDNYQHAKKLLIQDKIYLEINIIFNDKIN